MLEELKNVSQSPRVKGHRRWFADNEMELIAWYSESGEVSGFQLCYDIGRQERAFTWRRDKGLTHSSIDSGEASPFHNRSPMLVPNPNAPLERVIAEFRARSEKVDAEIIDLVLTQLT